MKLESSRRDKLTWASNCSSLSITKLAKWLGDVTWSAFVGWYPQLSTSTHAVDANRYIYCKDGICQPVFYSPAFRSLAVAITGCTMFLGTIGEVVEYFPCSAEDQTVYDKHLPELKTLMELLPPHATK